VLFLYLLVVAARKNLVLSSPSLVHQTIYLFPIIFLILQKSRDVFFRIFLNFLSVVLRGLFSSSLSRINRTSLQDLI
jgi:hypothetical protein